MTPPLLLLHGALGSEGQMLNFKRILNERFQADVLTFSGHGKRSTEDVSFSIEQFASDVLDFMDSHKKRQVNIFGYSMGGYVALYLARFFPERVNKIMTLGTKFLWTPDAALKEVKMLDPSMLEEKVPDFVDMLKKIHGSENWGKVVQKTASMMTRMGLQNPISDSDFVLITNPVLLTLGDLDKMVSKAETERIQGLIKGSNVLILENTVHPFEKTDLIMLEQKVNKYFR